MSWLETVDGYVRRDAIIDVHINQCYPSAVYVLLTSGDSVKVADYSGKENGEEKAEKTLEELMDWLIGQAWDETEFIRLLP